MELKISRILHAGYLFDCGLSKIAFDPIFEIPFSRNCYAFPSIKFDLNSVKNLKLDAVFISHFHDDHCSFESLDLLDRDIPIYLFCIYEELFTLLQSLGFKKVYQLKLDESVELSHFKIIPRRAFDRDVDAIFHIEIYGLNILNVVDSLIDDEVLNQLSQTAWDLILWPFQTMREIEVLSPFRFQPSKQKLPEEWRTQLQTLNPRFLIPSSCQFIQEDWSWYNQALFPMTYKKFETEMKNILPRTGILRLNPGNSIELDHHSIKQSSPLEWVIPIGNQEVDYQYEPSLSPPKTKEISKHFRALSQKEEQVVSYFCESDLLKKFREIGAPESLYFNQSRIWLLSIYDHEGHVKNYRYFLKEDEIYSVDESIGPHAWKTEVSLFKLFAALTLGETLTSMYLRINDEKFSEALEAELEEVNIMDDPLIRCLFTGVFANYQKAQLKNILNSK